MTRKVIFKVSALMALLVFIIVTVSFTSVERKLIACNGVTVTFDREEHFITAESIQNTIKRKFTKLNGALLDTLNTENIEQELSKNPWIKKAEVFKGFLNPDSTIMSGCLRINIIQEQPFFRVMNGDQGFYVTKEGKRLPFSDYGTAKVLIVTGQTSEKFINDKLLEFITYVQENEFWNAQIQQINIQNNGDLLLVPRVGNQLIVFGKPEKIELRFRNLKALYTQGFSKEGWDKYKTISLKYDNQVVCTLR